VAQGPGVVHASAHATEGKAGLIVLNLTEGPGDLDFLTWTPDPSSRGSRSGVAEAYEEISGHLLRRAAVPLQERIFAELGAAPEALLQRAAVLQAHGLVPGVPPTCVEGRPGAGSGVAGIHIVSVRPGPGSDSDRVLEQRGEAIGRSVSGTEAGYLGLSDVGRMIPAGSCLGPAEETAAVYTLLDRALSAEGWSIRDVRRTWFYLHRILDWYDDFNRVRTHALKGLGAMSATCSGPLPASTGIRGTGIRGNWCTLDVLAMRALEGHAADVRRLINPQQNEAPEYGSAFSRGLSITTERARYLLISGTASIDDSGRSMHSGDFARQTERTLDVVASLLAAAHAGLPDICQATAFIKRPEDLPDARRALDRVGLGAVLTVADVCRDELLFELDAIAVLPATSRPNGGA